MLIIAFLIFAWSLFAAPKPVNADAQEKAPPKIPLSWACSTEIDLLCKDLPRRRTLSCLAQHRQVLTTSCRTSLTRVTSHAAEMPAQAADTAPASPQTLVPTINPRRAPKEDMEGRLTKIEGTVYLHTPAQAEGEFIPADIGIPLSAGDWVRTGEDGTAEIALDGHSLIQVTSNSDFIVNSLNPAQTEFYLGIGRLVAKLRVLLDGEHLRFRTSTAVAAVRGTELGLVQDEPNQPSVVGVFGEGRVSVSSVRGEGEIMVGPDQETQVYEGGAPLPPRPLAVLGPQKSLIEQVKQRMAYIQKVWIPRSPAQRRALRDKLTLTKPIPSDQLSHVREDRRRLSHSAARKPLTAPSQKPHSRQRQTRGHENHR